MSKVIARHAHRALAPDDVLAAIDFNHLHIVLITDQDVAVLEHEGAAGSRIRNTAHPRVGVVSPDHVAGGIDVNNAVVAAIGNECRAIR